MPFLYILECADGTYYTGSTWSMEKRFWEHTNFKGANYTKKRQPLKVVFCEEFERMEEAYSREKQVQGWSHAKKKALIEKNFKLVHELARGR
jgi:putative endonuclease